jgi:hypothetical protein
MSAQRILLCTFADGDTKLTNDGCALLLGTSVHHLLEVWNPEHGLDSLPTDLKRKGQKRSKAARDATGTNATNVCLAFWALYEWGARVDHDGTGGQLWAILDDLAP